MFFLSEQKQLPRVRETGGLGPAPRERRRSGDVRNRPAFQRHQGASAHGQEGRGAPGPAHGSGSDRNQQDSRWSRSHMNNLSLSVLLSFPESGWEGGEVPRAAPHALLLVHRSFCRLHRRPVSPVLLLHHVQVGDLWFLCNDPCSTWRASDGCFLCFSSCRSQQEAAAKKFFWWNKCLISACKWGNYIFHDWIWFFFSDCKLFFSWIF